MRLPITIGNAEQDAPGPHPSMLLRGGDSPTGLHIVVPAGERTPDEWLTARETVDLEEAI